jgi:uncharacterized membrane protein
MTLTRLSLLIAAASLVALIALCVAWELWAAPLRPGGSWMVLKALPLLAPLFGVLHGRRYTFRWAMMLIVLYFVEGVMRAYADVGLSARLALLELILALTFCTAAAVFLRARNSVNPVEAAPTARSVTGAKSITPD